MVQDGGMIYGVQGGEQSLEGNGRAERSWCGVGDEVERDWRIEHVIGFRSLNEALGLSVRDTGFRICGNCEKGEVGEQEWHTLVLWR